MRDSELVDLKLKVVRGERLSHEDCVRLWQTSDLTSLAAMANLHRERLSGRRRLLFRPVFGAAS